MQPIGSKYMRNHLVSQEGFQKSENLGDEVTR
jgi:hypothetical protein